MSWGFVAAIMARLVHRVFQKTSLERRAGRSKDSGESYVESVP